MKFTLEFERLLKIYSIPLEEKWEKWAMPESYTVYKYWQNLGLLNQSEYDKTFRDKVVQPNPILVNFFKSIMYHFKPQYYKNGQVADVGSGFGFITFWLILTGASKVHSIGDPERIAFISKLYNRAVEKGLIQKGKLLLKPDFIKNGDTTLSEAITANSLNLVLLNDTLEHINPRIFSSLVKSAFNDLKPNGCFISRQQNTDSTKQLTKLKIIWNEIEKNSFIGQRLNVIKEKCKGIVNSDANKLAKNTRGFDSEDFFKAIDNYNISKIFPELNLELPAIDIETDVPCEGNTEINRICNEFLKIGFRTIKIYFDLLSSRRSKYFQPFARLFSSLFLKLRLFDETTVFFIKKYRIN